MKSPVIVSLLALFIGSDAWAAGSLQPGKVKLNRDAEVQFWIHLPQGYEESKQRFPLILFLHGGGESGADLEKVKIYGLPKEILNGRKVPAIVLAPQNPHRKGLWDDRVIYAFLEDQISKLRVDESRIYLTGLSRGGHGVFRLAFQHPKRFAAVAVMCGGGPISYAGWCKDVPFWFFHGDRDKVVPTEESRRLSAAIRRHGGEAKLTIYPDTGHNCWTPAFAGDALYEWLFSKRLKP